MKNLDHDLPFRVRRLAEKELLVGPPGRGPLVLGPRRSTDARALPAALREAGPAIVRSLCAFGFVLLRGFAIRTPADFERATRGIVGLRAIPSYLCMEPGRERLDGTQTVLCTNRGFRTGGGWSITGFHSENYYAPEVPNFQAFCCLSEPRLGGETAFVNMAAVYAALSPELRERLEARPYLARIQPLAEVAACQGVDVDTMRRYCREADLRLEMIGGVESLVTCKAPVVEHPFDGRRSLQVNASGEIPGLHARLAAALLPLYDEWEWTLHRLVWRSRQQRPRQRGTDPGPTPAPRGPGLPPPLAAAFNPALVDHLARAMCRQVTVFPWQRGDIVLFDNLQLLHAGLPGLGRRELAVQVFNPSIAQDHGTGVGRGPLPRR